MIESNFLRNIRTLMIDVDGTLLKGDVALPGAIELFKFLEKNGLKFLVMTNNSTKSPQDYSKKLSNAGFNIRPENIITSSTITAQYLCKNFPDSPVFVIGQSGIFDALAEKNIFPLTDLSQNAGVVIVAGDYDLTYEKIKNAILHIQRGAKFIGTNPDLLVPTEEGLVPECGTTIAAIEAATGKKALIIGKPNKLMFDLAIKINDTQHSQIAIVGDRLSTDIVGGINAGISTILIETGVDNRETISNSAAQPDLIVKDFFELISFWQEAIINNPGSKNG